MKTTIYTLEDPITYQIKYVGITSGLLTSRLKSHIKESKLLTRTKKSAKQQWILDLLKQNLTPIISELETVSEDMEYTSLFIEPYWIWQFKSWGFDLFNIQGFDFHIIKSVGYKTPINQYDLDGNFLQRFISIAIAERDSLVNSPNIQRAARLQQGYKAGVFQWRYDKDFKLFIGISKSKNLPNKEKLVLQLLDNKIVKEWLSGQQAAEQLKLHKSKISLCCNGKRKTHGGFSWAFK